MAVGDRVIGERGEELVIVWDGAHHGVDADLLLTHPRETKRDPTGDSGQLKRRESGGISLRKFGKLHSTRGAA